MTHGSPLGRVKLQKVYYLKKGGVRVWKSYGFLMTVGSLTWKTSFQLVPKEYSRLES